MDILSLSLVDLVAAVRAGTLSSDEVYRFYAERIARLDPQLNAFITTNEPTETPSVDTPLAGIPLGVKDIFCENGIRTAAASHMLENFIPPYDATLITRLKQAGFRSIGKCNMDEFSMGWSGENSAFGVTRNPWDTERIPGGTSSGSAAAVAAGLVPAALGWDTGGSIRQPASMCGVVGFKPTYGRNSRYGVLAMGSSLDTPGTLTKTVRDAAFLYELMAGHDPLDSTSLTEKVSVDPSIWSAQNLKGMRIGVPKEYFIGEGFEPAVKAVIEQAIAKLASLGAEIKEVSLPHTEYALSVYYTVMAAEVSTNLARYDGIRFGYQAGDGMDVSKNRAEGFGAEAKRRIMLGAFVLSSGFYDAYYRRASLIRELIKRDFTDAFAEVDALAMPVSPMVAWKIGAKIDDPLMMYLADIFTVPNSLANLPGLSVPAGFALPSDGTTEMPVGLQLVGPKLGEETLFRIGHVFEQSMASTLAARKPVVY